MIKIASWKDQSGCVWKWTEVCKSEGSMGHLGESLITKVKWDGGLYQAELVGTERRNILNERIL